MKKAIVIAFLVTQIVSLKSQTIKNYEAIGHVVDHEGNLLHNYLEVDYLPEKLVEKSFNMRENFSPGRYYDLNGKSAI